MSSKNGYVPVKMVRIKWPDKQNPITHRENVKVGIIKDFKNNCAYFRIDVNERVILSENLSQFEWVEESCLDGVATIKSSSMNVIIIYDYQNNDNKLKEFFNEMQNLIKQKQMSQPTTSIVSSPDSNEVVINELIKHIENNSPNEAKFPAKYLAQKRANIHFTLRSQNDKQQQQEQTPINNMKNTKSSNVLEIKLQIECHLNKDPVIETIYVRRGTKLRALKDQIENETGISRKDQYWYAFDQYLINDDYEFGSTESVVIPPKNNAPKNKQSPPTDPIRDGDTLTMYIAQIPPFK